MSFKLINWNCNGANKETISAILKVVSLKRISVVILTEIHRRVAKINLRGWNCHHTKSPDKGKRASRGVLILTRNDVEISKVVLDVNERYLKCKLKIEGVMLKLLAIYAPAARKEKIKFWNSKFINSVMSNQDIVCGDFNFVEDPTTDCTRHARSDFDIETRSKVSKMFSSYVDVAKTVNCLDFTYRNVSRIDRVYINPNILSPKSAMVTSTTLEKDHNVLITSINLLNVSTAQWRFRHYLLLSEEDKDLAESILADVKEESWEKSKFQIIEKLKEVEKKLLRKYKEAAFRAKALLKKFPNSSNASIWRCRLKRLYGIQDKARRLWIRMKKTAARELPSEWTTSKVKPKTEKKTIKATIDLNGVEHTTDNEILSDFQKFYSNLYKKVPNDDGVLDEMLKSWIPSSLDLSALAKPIAITEIEEVIKQSKAKKSPGIDGLTNMAYKLLGDKPLKRLQIAMNNCMISGTTPKEWKEGVIVLLYKKDSPKDPGNYRPITLLNSDYKLMCKILANRLNSVITMLIPNHQIGFMPQRLIYDNVLCLDLLLMKKYKTLVLDFKKAYDSINHDALLKVLLHVGLPKTFVNMVGGMLQGSSARLIINKMLSDPFFILRGVKQGDPLSPLLFAFAVELLARCPHAMSKHIPKIGKIHLGILMYADDTVLASTDLEGLLGWCTVLKRLERAMGLEINISKTFAICDNTDKVGPYRTVAPDEIFRYLGFNFSSRGIKRDFLDKSKQAMSKLNKWSGRNWNIFLKVSVMRAYCDSTLTYFAFVAPEIDNDLIIARRKFLSIGGKVKVRQERAERPWSAGGLGLVDDMTRYKALKANLGARILFDENMKIHHALSDIAQTKNLGVAYDGTPLRKSESNIINDLLECWRTNTPKAFGIFSVQDIQSHIRSKENLDKPLWTPRMKKFDFWSGINLPNIFKNVKRIPNLDLRGFMWLYFQGGLPFRHNVDCRDCHQPNVTSHKHLFVDCSHAKKVWTKAQRMVDIFFNTHRPESIIRSKTRPRWSEKAIWHGWSNQASIQVLDYISAAALFTIWHTRNIPDSYIRKRHAYVKISEVIRDTVLDIVTCTKNIKSASKRLEKMHKVKDKWILNSKSWIHFHGQYEWRAGASRYIESGLSSNDARNYYKIISCPKKALNLGYTQPPRANPFTDGSEFISLDVDDNELRYPSSTFFIEKSVSKVTNE